MNCARIYNHALAVRYPHIVHNKLAFPDIYHHYCRPEREWQCSLWLRSEEMLNGFFIYSVLLENAERHTCLMVNHDATSQRLRLEPALAERNEAMEGVGQENYPHACDSCFLVLEHETTQIGGPTSMESLSFPNFFANLPRHYSENAGCCMRRYQYGCTSLLCRT